MLKTRMEIRGGGGGGWLSPDLEFIPDLKLVQITLNTNYLCLNYPYKNSWMDIHIYFYIGLSKFCRPKSTIGKSGSLPLIVHNTEAYYPPPMLPTVLGRKFL